MVFPELALGTGSFGRLGRFLRVGVDAVKRKVTINYLNIFWVSVYQTLQQGGEPCAARSLKIAVLDDRNRRLWIAQAAGIAALLLCLGRRRADGGRWAGCTTGDEQRLIAGACLVLVLLVAVVAAFSSTLSSRGGAVWTPAGHTWPWKAPSRGEP